ncbi:GDP-mannose 4,6-dehydratase [Terrabacter tumescens]|uniref:GDP-mannose 4,6-dehydratase n=1 Tax=Terrabacter tumescens TaxID=60443 RepID=A0ABQ2IFJ3_9MICO|nr:NAD-dependent epimerase/dehydratase family protein [Terrabacter tumescens]GGN09649.1 GDP-mannose 4,6-dehydratase [Terrabacter tumescens]
MTRHALVTGVSGFTGRHLARRLLADGWSVTGTVRSRSAEMDGVEERQIDVDDWRGLRALVAEVRPDVVYHLAAVVDTVTTPDLARLYRTNTIGTAAVLDAVSRSGTASRVLVASSAFAYGRVTHGADKIHEDTPLAPITAYGASKAAAEAISQQWWRQTGVDLVVARGFQHTGPGHVGAYALADWARQLAAGATTLEVGNLDVVRDYLDVRDVAAAYLELVEAGRPGEVYNVGSGIGRSMRQMLDGLVEAFERDVAIRSDVGRFRPSDQPVFVADVAKLRRDTRWVPEYPIEKTLADLARSALDGATARGSD